MENLKCSVCQKKFNHLCSLKRHIDSVHKEVVSVKCMHCEKIFSRKDVMLRHVRQVHSSDRINIVADLNSKEIDQPISKKRKSTEDGPHSSKRRLCETCQMYVGTCEWTNHIRTNSHKEKSMTPVPHTPFMKIRQCFQGKVETFVLGNKNEEIINIKAFMVKCKPDVLNLLKESLQSKGNIKVSVELFAEFVKYSTQGEEDHADISIKSFKTPMEIVLENQNIDEIFCKLSACIDIKSEVFDAENSGWSLLRIKHLEININEYKPLRGSTYIKLPRCIDAKKACVNVQNNDVYCFKWAIISALCPASRNAQRVSSYSIANINNELISLPNHLQLNFGKLNFPLKLEDISLFETLNSTISVNVFGIEARNIGGTFKVIGPYYSTRNVKEKHINLLFIQDDVNSHYVWIKNMSRLISMQVNHGNRSIRMCNACLLTFNTEKAFEKHQNECNKMVTDLPKENANVLKFEHHSRSMVVPFTFYADFECMLKNVESCQPDPSKSSTTSIKEHVPVAVSYYLKCSFDPTLDKLFQYTGKNEWKKI